VQENYKHMHKQSQMKLKLRLGRIYSIWPKNDWAVHPGACMEQYKYITDECTMTVFNPNDTF